ncbi:hypothetical protein DSECCO2_610600 [anaerobic digester metagenome]
MHPVHLGKEPGEGDPEGDGDVVLLSAAEPVGRVVVSHIVDEDGEVVVEHHRPVAPIGDLGKHPPRLLLDPVPDHLQEVVRVVLDEGAGQFQAPDLPGERLLLPGEVLRPGEPPCLILDLCRQAGYASGDCVPLLPCRRNLPLAARDCLLCCRDRSFVKPEVADGRPDPEQVGLPTCEEVLLCLERLEEAWNLLEADPELKRSPVRRFGTAALLTKACEPLRVKREADEFSPGDLQPLPESVDPCENSLLLLLQRRSPRETGLCLRVGAV